MERIIEEEEKRRKKSADYFNSSNQYADIFKDALNEEEQRKKLGFSTPFEFAIYEELESIKKNPELSKATTKKIFKKLSEETKIIGWKTKRSSEKKMSIGIYDLLVENGYPEKKIEDVAQMIIDLAKRHL